MHPPSQQQPPCGSPPPQQNKVILQREYREKESECFNALRDVLKHFTREELRTRQDVLKKAIEILESVSVIQRWDESGAQAAGGLTSHETQAFVGCELGDVGSAANGGYFPAQPPHFYPPLQSNDATMTYYNNPQFHEQQYPFPSGSDSTYNQTGASGHTGGYYPL